MYEGSGQKKKKVPSVSAEDAFLLYRPPITFVIPGHLPFQKHLH